MRSQSARPCNDSRSSQQTLPTVRISFTPGAAVATKSKTRASGPRRPSTGTRACTLRYSRNEASVFICIANTPGCTCWGSKPTGGCSNNAVRFPLASTSTRRTRFPRSAASRATAAVTVLLPTPPFPVKKSNRRSRIGGPSNAGSSNARSSNAPGSGPMGVELAAEADVLAGAVAVDLDVGDLVDGRTHPPTLGVGEPHDGLPVGHGGVDEADDVVDLTVELEAQLLGCVQNPDAYFHAPESSRRCSGAVEGGMPGGSGHANDERGRNVKGPRRGGGPSAHFSCVAGLAGESGRSRQRDRNG